MKHLRKAHRVKSYGKLCYKLFQPIIVCSGRKKRLSSLTSVGLCVIGGNLVLSAITGEILFFDILVKCCPSNTFVSSIYQKKAFTRLYIKWESFTPLKYKVNLARMPTYRCFSVCSTTLLLQSAVKDLSKTCVENGYPHSITTFNIYDILSKNKPNKPVVTVPKKDVCRLPEEPATLLLQRLHGSFVVRSRLYFCFIRVDTKNVWKVIQIEHVNPVTDQSMCSWLIISSY